MTHAGGLAFLLALLMLFVRDRARSSSQALARLRRAGARSVFFLLMVAAWAKAAQFPFHTWLPDAMEAPTPISAYLHAAAMVKAGVYLMARASERGLGDARGDGDRCSARWPSSRCSSRSPTTSSRTT